jgi:Uma2 family endonuclease
MSIGTVPPAALPSGEDAVCIPARVVDLASFRRWTLSDQFPQQGRIDYVGGDIWVDMTMEEFFGHNQVKGEFTIVLGGLARSLHLGRFIHDRMRLVHEAVDLSCEPDGAFAFWETFRIGRLRLVPEKQGIMELEGTPDMVLEVVSASSVTKDTRELRRCYWQVGIAEYWLVDVRREPLRFEILRRGATDYIPAPATEGWLLSQVFGKEFRLTKQTDPLGQPLYTLETRP